MQLAVLFFWALLICGAGLVAYVGSRLGRRPKWGPAAFQLALGIGVLLVLGGLAVLTVGMSTMEHVPGEDPVVGLAPFYMAVAFAAVALPVFSLAGLAGFLRGRSIAKRAAQPDAAPDARDRREDSDD